MSYYTLLPQQSPIDLGRARPITHRFPTGHFDFHWDALERGVWKEGPHGPEIEFDRSASYADLILPGAGSPTRFALWKFHFHSESEHRVDGRRWPLELHVVHRASEPDPFVPGAEREIYLVVGVFLDRRADDTPKDDAADRFIRGLVRGLESIESKAGGGPQASDPVRPRDLLPDDPSAYWRYEGSLTTQVDRPNGGYVSWIVLEDVKKVDGPTLDRYVERLRHEAKGPQDRDRRFVLYNPKAGPGGADAST